MDTCQCTHTHTPAVHGPVPAALCPYISAGFNLCSSAASSERGQECWRLAARLLALSNGKRKKRFSEAAAHRRYAALRVALKSHCSHSRFILKVKGHFFSRIDMRCTILKMCWLCVCALVSVSVCVSFLKGAFYTGVNYSCRNKQILLIPSI